MISITMMIKKSNIWLLVVLSAMMLACKGNKGIQAVGTNGENATGLYDAQNAGRAEVQTAGATMRQTAKTVVMYEMPAPLKDRPEQILKRKGYTVSYNSETKNPNWVAWHLTKSHTYGSFQRRQEMFSEDESVKAPRATNNDYFNSRYDRGHMCPAGDNKWDKEAMTQSFLFTNICPQNHGLNKYEWNDLEIQCRDWAREYGAVDIVCGPLYSSKGGRYKVGSSREPQQKTIGRNKVWVPDAFFKVVLCRQGRPKAIGFVYRNEGVKQLKTEAVRTVDEIEALTGIDFFPALDDDMENRVEASANLSDW
jgi:endonuclease G